MRLPSRLIATLAVLPALASCSSEGDSRPPLTKEALAAIAQEPGAPIRQLAREVDDLFSKEDLGETRALVVMHGGTIAAERYAPGYGPDTRFVSWSMAKTVTAVLIGMLIADGRLRLDETPPVPRWQRPGDPRGEITLRQLLQMRSGLRHSEAIDPPYESGEVRMLFLDGRDDMAEFAESQPLEAEPGSKFEYSSNTTVILADIAARVLTRSRDPDVRRRAVSDYLHNRLFRPLGMNSMVPEFDRAGTLIGGSLIHGTARDWARFGDFLRNKGSYKGTQLVPRRWIEFMVTPSPRRGNYGAQTWLNRDPPADDDPLFATRGPRSLFAMIGHMGQYVLVAPDRKLVVARLGHSDETERPPMAQELADIVALYPGR
ncbi:hypothetical protein GCM10011515_23200 [Tsuneonella deserti]|uniref:Beta-lactamase-related domain-containing protein n=1 Tax=Tsuneonella deserti TaxID=2035528 RepID=A0ABQ1SCH8_9SPHN|nr:serine hydrolase [Tsuneonella deserti]GGE02943.1 hypothetical protein GCM10011515_23200 [Tsuneonella deserti]